VVGPADRGLEADEHLVTESFTAAPICQSRCHDGEHTSAAARVPEEAAAAPSVTSVPNVHWTRAVRVVLRRACYFVLRRALSWKDYYQALRELDCLSELDLRDMGVTRAEISFLAWSEACRRYEERRRSAKLVV
jgi:uncharacterized protein YjiS (DUF1127 family)